MRPDPRSFNDTAKKPLGETARELVEAAMEHEKRHEIQRDILSGIFNSVAGEVEKVLNQKLPQLLGHLFRLPEGQRVEQAIADLTTGQFPTVIPLKLPIDPKFTDFALEDIKAMPGWIKIHQIAQKADIAVRLVGVTKEDGGEGGGMPPHIALDLLKPYSESDWSSSPDLPQIEQKTNVQSFPMTGRQKIG